MMQPDPQQPHTYPRRILLAVAANSPQIVTETLYALACQTTPPWIPTEVHVITTLRGASFVRDLGHTGSNQLGKLCADYALPLPLFNDDHIHLITDAQGQPLDDIRTGHDNTHAADFITRTVQHFTADPAASLHVSLSGGRRTMTYYIGYALSLFARAQDRLSHVLVEEEFYFNTEFYYPPPHPVWVMRDDQSGFDASKVEVTLADMPFVRLREGLPTELLQGDASFSSTISAAQRSIQPLQVRFEYHENRLTCGQIHIPMAPVNLAFYVWMLERRTAGLPPVARSEMGNDDLTNALLHTYRRLHGSSGTFAQIESRLLGVGADPLNWFDERKSHVNKALSKALGKQGAQPYEIHASGKRPRMVFGVDLPLEVIDLEEEKIG